MHEHRKQSQGAGPPQTPPPSGQSRKERRQQNFQQSGNLMPLLAIQEAPPVQKVEVEIKMIKATD